MNLRITLISLVIVVSAVGVGAWLYTRDSPAQLSIRQELFTELQPVALKNCRIRRYGEPGDGGYALCENLLKEVGAAYSYGINGYDKWGCDLSTDLNVPVHRYDCFNTQNPTCPGGEAVFHAECIGTDTAVIDGRPFDSLANQLQRNGDAERRIVMKIDVEGAEWETFLHTPAGVLERIDQLAVEFHIPRYRPRFAVFVEPWPVVDESFVTAVKRLKQYFYVANLHFNNYTCTEDFEPLPARAFEVLFVSKRLDEVDSARRASVPHPLDQPNRANWPDCQAVPTP